MMTNQQIAALLIGLSGQLSAAANSDTFTREDRIQAIQATVHSDEVRKAFMESVAEVILPLIEEQTTIRDIFRVEKLSPGAQAVYDIPFDDVEAVFWMPQIGGTPTVQVEGAEMRVDTFAVHGGIEWQMDIARDGRFQVVQNALALLARKFVKIEESAGWSLIKAHAAALDSTQQLQAYTDAGAVAAPGSGKMNIYTLAELITRADEIGTGGRRVTDIYMSPRRFNDLRLQVGNTALPEDMRSQAWSGTQNVSNPVETDIRFHKVYNTALVANNKAYAFTQRDGFFYGVMPIRDDVMTIDDPVAIKEWKQGVAGRARYGFGVIDDKGQIEITF